MWNKKTFLMSSALLLLITPFSVALADPESAPAQTPSDRGGSYLHLDFSQGQIDVKDHEANVQAGYLMDSQGNQGASLQLDLEKKFVSDSTVDQSGYGGFMLNPGIHGRIDGARDANGNYHILRANAELTGITSYSAQANGFRERPISSYEQCNADENLASSKDRWGNLSYYCINKKTKPFITGEVDAPSLSARFQMDNTLGFRQFGAQLKGVQLSGHVATVLNDSAQFDFYGALAPLNFILGNSTIENNSSSGAYNPNAKAGLGISVGKIGRLGEEAGVNLSLPINTGDTVLDAYNTVSLSKIADIPVNVSWKFENTSVSGSTPIIAKAVNTNIFSVGGAF